MPASACKRVPPNHSARFHGTDQNFRPVQPLREYGRLMGSDSHPRILRLSPLISKRIDYLCHSRVFRQCSILDNEVSCTGSQSIFSPFRYMGQPSVLYTPFGASLETGASVLPEKTECSLRRSPADTTPRHSGLFPPFGRASIDRRRRPRFGLRSSGTALHFLPFGIPLPARAGSTGH